MTQKQMILEYLQRAGDEGITPRQAEDYFGCMRLASRIADLKRDGYFIDVELVKVRTRNNKHTHVARYTLHGRTQDVEQVNHGE